MNPYTQHRRRRFLLHISTAVSMCLTAPFVFCQQEESSGPGRDVAAEDRQARHLFDKALELMDYKQYERGIAMLNTIVRDNPSTNIAYKAHLAMGKHYLEQRNNKDALGHFMLLTRVLAPAPGEKLTSEVSELYHESLFQAGLAHYQGGQYNSCFPLFRRLTEVAGRTKWANMAYYHIGMSHYQLKNWSKAIDSLSLVGTEVDAAGTSESDELGRIEIGQRFYSKIEDADIPIMRKLGLVVEAEIRVSSGDVERIEGVAVPGKPNEILASAPTALGAPIPNDGIIQMIGGDTLEVIYTDDSTADGQKGIQRTGKVRAVSTGTVGFYLGDNSTPSYIAYPGQPQIVILRDADLDKSDEAETTTLTVISRYKVEASEGAETDDLLDIFSLEGEDEDVWKERDRITLKLTENGKGESTRTGQFIGKIDLVSVVSGVEPDTNDDKLTCDELDELYVTYKDEVHLYGDEARETEATVKVSGSVNSGVTADQHVVFEKLLKARKGSVEAEALVGLGSIYKEMGLDQRANGRANEALGKINSIIINRNDLPGELVEQAFRLKWESELLKDDFDSATATCLAFNRLYPESVLADQALMTLGRGLTDKGQYDQAVDVYQKVLALENPISAAEAQFRIGVALEEKAVRETEESDEHNSKWGIAGLSKATALQNRMSPAINAYRKTFQTYPESSFAADALGLVIRHYVETNNFSQAANLLESVFSDYPDAEFLDEMLLLWANVAFRMGDNNTAKNKLQQLIFDYPTSEHVAEARKRMAGLEAESAPPTSSGEGNSNESAASSN